MYDSITSHSGRDKTTAMDEIAMVAKIWARVEEITWWGTVLKFQSQLIIILKNTDEDQSETETN